MVQLEKQSQLLSQESVRDVEEGELENVVGGMGNGENQVNASTPLLGGNAKHVSDMTAPGNRGTYTAPTAIQAPTKDTLKVAGIPPEAHDSVLKSLLSRSQTMEVKDNKVAVRTGVYVH